MLDRLPPFRRWVLVIGVFVLLVSAAALIYALASQPGGEIIETLPADVFNSLQGAP